MRPSSTARLFGVFCQIMDCRERNAGEETERIHVGRYRVLMVVSMAVPKLKD